MGIFQKTYLHPIVLLLSFFLAGCASQPSTPGAEVVFLLHGMGRTRASMGLLARRFRKAGYRTVNLKYSSRTQSLEEISKALKDSVRENASGRRYHFVGHSLGNIIVRNGFKTGYPPGLGRIVMIAPPNRSAMLAKAFKDFMPYKWLMGDSGQKLSQDAFYEDLPVPTVEFGVIAGDRGSSLLSEKPNDVIVLVEATRLKGMSDFKVLHHGHTFIMNARDTFESARTFIETGRF